MILKNVKTPMDLADYIKENMDSIFVRHQKDGKWGSYSLTEIDSRTALKWVLTWIKEGRIPAIYKKPEVNS